MLNTLQKCQIGQLFVLGLSVLSFSLACFALVVNNMNEGWYNITFLCIHNYIDIGLHITKLLCSFYLQFPHRRSQEREGGKLTSHIHSGGMIKFCFLQGYTQWGGKIVHMGRGIKNMTEIGASNGGREMALPLSCWYCTFATLGIIKLLIITG